MRLLALLLAGALAFAGPAGAADFRLAPYKDELFAYKKIVGTRYDGDFVMVEFSLLRDQKQRDEIEAQKAKPEYVSLDANRFMEDLTLPSAMGRQVQYVAAGRIAGGARMVVVFLHGQVGNRKIGMTDWGFGGNFNRLKNLMVLNDGVYLTPGFANFGDRGAADVKALIDYYALISPGAPIVVICTSRSGEICFRLLDDDEAAAKLGGMVLLATLNEESFFQSRTFTDPARHVPIYIGHGSSDSLTQWVTQDLFFRKIKETKPDYPIRFDLFVSGVHGTPMRMIDWRLVLNWILEQG